MNKFIDACNCGDLKVCKWLFNQNKYLNIRYDNDFAFRSACGKGYFELVKWIMKVRPNTNIHENDDEAFRISSARGHLKISKWLWSLNDRIDIHSYEGYALYTSCHRGDSEMVRWLFALDPHLENYNIRAAFQSACVGHRSDVVEVLMSLFTLDKLLTFTKFKIITVPLYRKSSVLVVFGEVVRSGDYTEDEAMEMYLNDTRDIRKRNIIKKPVE